ncbi:MAG: bifunctional DNA primase/polymerase [Paracoccaceae bacterium]|nr:bifunctional DNA primase/polymerase [Paracoccaceae bacterium]
MARQAPSADVVGEGECLKPFSVAALDLHDHGLTPIPLGGEDGKTPRVKTASMTRRPSRATLRKWAEQYPTANVGILTGLSSITVIDIDDQKLVPAMLERFGATPLQIGTPSGGVHLYYQSARERSCSLRNEDLAVDVKGLGGMVVVPPSVRPTGPYTGRQYRFLHGDWADLPNLPTLRPGSLSMAATSGRVVSLARVGRGRRNKSLFRYLLRQVR